MVKVVIENGRNVLTLPRVIKPNKTPVQIYGVDIF